MRLRFLAKSWDERGRGGDENAPIGRPFGRFGASWRRRVLEACWLMERRVES